MTGVTTTSDIAVMRSADNGATWTAPAPHFVGGTPIDLEGQDAELATNGAGTWLVAWESRAPSCIGTTTTVRISRSTDAGATWSAPLEVDSAVGGPCGLRRPSVAGDAAGNWIVTFVGYDGAFLPRIQVTRSSDDGASWTTPQLVSSAAAASFFPAVAVGGSGTWLLVYERNGSATGAGIIAHRSSDAGATWSPPVTVRQGLNATRPRLASDGAGTWTAVWYEQDKNGPSDLSMLVARSEDDGLTWGPHEPLEGNARLDAIHRDDDSGNVASDGMGGWLAAWTTQADRAVRLGDRP